MDDFRLTAIAEHHDVASHEILHMVQELTAHHRIQYIEHLPELRGSLLNLGVGDFFSSSLVTPEQRQAFAADLQRRIALFEPRLENLSVTLQQDAAPERRSLHLRISAEFRMQPGLPPMIFESRVDPVGGLFSVSEGRHG